GVAIADITKDSKDLQLTNFILGILPNNPKGNGTTSTSPSTPTSSTSQSSPPNTGKIVGGVIGSIIFVSALVAFGTILYRKRHRAKMSNPLIDINNQACSDTNPQVYSDINFQAMSQDSCNLSPTKPKILVGYYPAYKHYSTPELDFNVSSSINYLNFIAFGPNDLVNNGANPNVDGDPFVFFQIQFSKFSQLLNYKTRNNLKFKNNLTKIFNKQSNDLNQDGVRLTDFIYVLIIWVPPVILEFRILT
ncbi:15600_t:CDS:2, partial [Racocetra persica]